MLKQNPNLQLFDRRSDQTKIFLNNNKILNYKFLFNIYGYTTLA